MTTQLSPLSSVDAHDSNPVNHFLTDSHISSAFVSIQLTPGTVLPHANNATNHSLTDFHAVSMNVANDHPPS